MAGIKSRWTDWESTCVKKAFEEKIQLKIMAIALRKTLTSVSKKIKKLGLRDTSCSSRRLRGEKSNIPRNEKAFQDSIKMKDILKGELVRLSAVDHEELGKAYAKWNQDSELTRFLDARMVSLHSAKAISDFFEKEIKEASPMAHSFAIRALEDNRLLGDIGL